MKVLPIKVVCDRCARQLARFTLDGEAGRGGLSVRGQATIEHNPAGEPRVVFDCPNRQCRSHVVVKIATIARRAASGETVIGV